MITNQIHVLKRRRRKGRTAQLSDQSQCDACPLQASRYGATTPTRLAVIGAVPANWPRSMFLATLCLISAILLLSQPHTTLAQQRTYLVPGHNMDNLRIQELQAPGSVVYQLKAVDPSNENRKITYAMTGDTFSVDEETGEVRLVKPLDRERQAQVSTVINVLGSNSEQPLESRRRVVIIDDVDDSWPTFVPHKYSISAAQNQYAIQVEISEQAPNGSVVLSELQVTDADEGANAEISFECRPKQSTNSACDYFKIESRRLASGRYSVTIKTKAPLDYERTQSFRLSLVARGRQPSPLKGVPLESEAQININVINAQDEGPVFVNAPYSLSMPEGLKNGTRLLSLVVQDGDRAPQRDLSVIVGPGQFSEYFRVTKDPEVTNLWYLETNATLDRENPEIVRAGNLFDIQVMAAELDESGSPIASEADLVAAMREPNYSKGTIRSETVSVVVLDLPDTSPFFVRANSELPIVNNFLVVNVSEAIATGAAVPNLNLAVQDIDQGVNSKFRLTLTDADIGPPASAAFALESEVIYGKAEVVLSVLNASLLDYEDSNLRTYRFSLVASKQQVAGETGGGPALLQMLEVQLNILDANDNAPEFDRDQYLVEVAENSPPGKLVASIKARDRDSNAFGRIEHVLRGPGASKFKLISAEGKILVNDCGSLQCLDHETQPNFFLTYEARDGGGLMRNVSVIISVLDLNDHAPRFTESVYKRELISDNLISKQNYILPQLVVRARDGDGPTQGRNNITYRIGRSNLTGLDVEPGSGLVYISQPLDLDSLVSRQAEAQVSGVGEPTNSLAPAATLSSNRRLVFVAEVIAEDNGTPPLNSSATILLVVRGNRDGAPQFKQDSYQAYVRENQPVGKPFFQVQAVDPDDRDSQLRYSLGFDPNDLVSVDPVSGELSFKNKVDFDEFNKAAYNITVYATDNNRPYPLRASVLVSILIQDVNDEAPQFEQQVYRATLSQGKTRPNEALLQVKARDSDTNAQLNYSIVLDSLSIFDRQGQEFTLNDIANSTQGYLAHQNRVERARLVQDLKRLFAIDRQTGLIELKAEPDYSLVASISFQVRVVDLNQEIFNQLGELQQDFAQCTMFLQSFVDRAPVFAPPWSAYQRDYNISILEELPVGAQVFSFLARDSNTGERIELFEKLFDSDPRDYFRVERSGSVLVNRRIDYEELTVQQHQPAHNQNQKQHKFLSLAVKAIAQDAQQHSVAYLNVQIGDINDNAPQFRNLSYQASVSESIGAQQEILSVAAEDRDSSEFGQVFYSLTGYTSELFAIHPRKGTISLRKNAKLDRELDQSHQLIAVASDCNDTKLATATEQLLQLSAVGEQPAPASTTLRSVAYELGGGDCKRSTAVLTINVLDENDNDPTFVHVNKRGELEATIAETASPNSIVAQALARDPDEGANGQVNYEIVRASDEPSQLSRLFKIDSDGFISVAGSLSGLGRAAPYRLTLRAYDQTKAASGSNSSSRQSYATLLLTINDVVANDGVPRFLRPRPNEVVELSESTGPSSFVYQVQAVDPDEESNGKLMYKFIQPSDTFEIDPFEGVIKTQHRASFFLDRELVPNYTLIVVAQDLGSPPKQAHQVLTIRITDVNEHEPYFERDPDDPPLVLPVEEELPANSLVGTIRAIDKDEGANALIGYEIVDGNQQNLFRLDFEGAEPGNSTGQPGGGQLNAIQANSQCRIYSTGRLDRETRDSYLLTIRASSLSKLRHQFFYSHRDSSSGTGRVSPFNQYNASDLSKIRVLVKLLDINDNRPVFLQPNAKSVVDSSADTFSQLMVLRAHDPDSSSSDIQYSLVDAVYFSDSKFTKSPLADEMSFKQQQLGGAGNSYNQLVSSMMPANAVSMRHVFDIDSRSGVLRNSISLRPYIDGYFEVYVKADSGSFSQQQAQASAGDPGRFALDASPPAGPNNGRCPALRTSLARPGQDQANSSSGGGGGGGASGLPAAIANSVDLSDNCNVAITKATVFVTHQRETFRFVFDKTKLNDRLDEFRRKVQEALESVMFEPATRVQASTALGGDSLGGYEGVASDQQQQQQQYSQQIPKAERVYLNTFNTDFYERDDGSLDFSTITACSQLVRFDDRTSKQQLGFASASQATSPNQVVDYEEVLELLKTLNATQAHSQRDREPARPNLFGQYGLVKIERCLPDKTMYRMTLSERLALYFALLMALVSALLALVVSKMHKSYERNLKLLQRSKYQYMSPYA